jgi:hypothetical protein
MTTLQLHLFNILYLALLVVFAFLTRATPRRIVGALAGGAAVGLVILGVVPLGEAAGWWRMSIKWEPYFLALLYIDCVISGALIFLMTWRVARRFGWRGLAAVVVLFTVLGPVRDYRYMATFPEWGAYAPGIAPVLAIAATYTVMIVLGHSVMRLVAGPARLDPLAQRPWKAAEHST